MTKVVVVGAGILGAAVTYRLATAGAQVTLLEAGRLGGGTSAMSVAWLNSNDKPPLEYHELNTGGLAEHQILETEFGVAPWLHWSGHLEWVEDEAARAKQRDKITRLHAWGYQAELLSPGEARRIEPDLAIPDSAEVAYYPREGYVDPVLFIGALTRAARRAGADVQDFSPVVEISRDGSRITGVVTQDGTRHAADVVVLCAGHWTDQVAELADVDVPLAPATGLFVVTAPAPASLRAIVHAPGITIRPDGAGRLMMRSAAIERLVTPDTPTMPIPAGCDQILERAVEVVPALAGTPLEAARIGVRPMPSDGYPLVGWVPNRTGLYILCTHSGVTLAPLLGRLTAREILDGTSDARLSKFRPERLVGERARV